MAITKSASSENREKSQKNKNRIIASVWLIMALLVAAAALAIWMFSSAPVFQEAAEEEQQPPAEVVAFNIAQVTQIDELHELDDAVQPISFDTLVKDLRDYPPEFKDAKYLKRNKGKWTLQVMDVSEHDIITDYLSARKDRDKFAYFRYRDDNDQPHYLLTYGSMRSESSAKGTADSVDFGLPSNVEVAPKKFSGYLDVIENYELSAPIKDLSSNRARKVRLQPTQREIAARRRAEALQDTDDSNEESDNQSADNSNGSTAGSSESTDIRGSRDTSDTLSVKEERKVVTPGSPDEEGRSNSGSADAQNETRPQGNTQQSNTPQSNNNQGSNTNNQQPSNNAEVDRIKQLIDEKTQ